MKGLSNMSIIHTRIITNQSGTKSAIAVAPQQKRDQRDARLGPDDDADITNGRQRRDMRAGKLATRLGHAARVQAEQEIPRHTDASWEKQRGRARLPSQ